MEAAIAKETSRMDINAVSGVGASAGGASSSGARAGGGGHSTTTRPSMAGDSLDEARGSLVSGIEL